MNILILNWRDPMHPLAGGAEIALYQHIKYWQKKGANVTWYSSSFEKSKEEVVFEKIKIYRKGSHYTVALHFFKDYLLGKHRDNDVIIDCFHFIPYLTPLYIGNKKIIALIHEVAREIWFKNIFFPLSLIGYFLEPFIIRFYRNKDYITVSNSTKKELNRLGISANKIHVVPNGLNLPRITKTKKAENPTVIFLGRLAKDKGVEDAIKALEILVKGNKDVSLWIVGKDENERYSKFLKQKVSELKLNKNIRFFGYVSEIDKANLLSKAWILIHPSLKEGWGLNVIEANSVGTIAVGYKVSGLKDSIINNKTGFLVDDRPENLASAVRKIIGDRRRRNLMSESAKEWSRKFNWDKSGSRSWEIITK